MSAGPLVVTYPLTRRSRAIVAEELGGTAEAIYLRTPSTPKDWRGFDHDRLVRVLNWIVTGAEIEPVPQLKLPSSDVPSRAPYGYRALDGFHRFYASIAEASNICRR